MIEPLPAGKWGNCETDGNETIRLKTCKCHLICYKSKMAKDFGTWKAGGRFRVNTPNKGIAEECAGNDGTKGWHGLKIIDESNGTVNLARALYRRADVYLLDDPLSAVDATTGRHMFEQAIGPSSMINGCTRILVTHSLAYLNQCDWIVVLDGGQVKSQGTFTELLKDEQTAKMIARLDNEATAAAAAEEETTAAVVGAAGVVERNSSSNNGGHLASGEESGDDNDADEVISDVASMLSSTFTSSPHHLRSRRHTRTSKEYKIMCRLHRPLDGPSSSAESSLPSSSMLLKRFGRDFAAGAVAACVAKTVIAPVERVKLILQLQTSQHTIAVASRYAGMVDCFVRLPREQGFRSFWRGNLSNVARAASQESLGMAFKELFRRWCVVESDRTDHYRRFLAGNLLAGGLAGSATFFVIYPLDFSRTRLAVDMGKVLFLNFKILNRGFLPSLNYIFLYRSAYYGLFDSFKVFVAEEDENGVSNVSFLAAFCIGQCSAFVAAVISYPLDTVRRRLMMQSGKAVRDYANAWDCIGKIYRHEGGRAFFSGFFVNAIRGVGAALVLAFYNDLTKLF
uniref:ADP/ATP translocase 1 n=1 Tax=Globodera pallida TaxID=36090 RepID=A0A183BJ28_GLOPA